MNLYIIGKIRSYLTVEQAKLVVHAYVISQLDANNALLAGTTTELKSQLQQITKNNKYNHVTYDLHLLPIKDCIIFKGLLLAYKSLRCWPSLPQRSPAFL